MKTFTIWKYELKLENLEIIEMPKGAEILAVQVQGMSPCIWALVDPSAEKEKRSFEIFGTGFEIPDNVERKFIGTFQLSPHRLVFHLFERIIK